MRALFVILVLALISGTVAYIGDIVGRQVAKRRMSLLGARPRKAGAVVAVMTGVVIALVSFGVLTLVSKDIRKWVYEYDRLTRDLSDLRAQYDTMSQSNEALKVSAERLNNELNDGRMELEEIRSELAETSGRLDDTGRKLDVSQSNLSSVTGRLHSNEKQLDETQSRLKSAGEKETELSEELSALENDNISLKQNREELVTGIDMLKYDSAILEARTKELEREEVRLSETIEELEKRLGDLKYKKIPIVATQPLAYIIIDSEWTGQQVREAIVSALSKLKHNLELKGYDLEYANPGDLEVLVSTLSFAESDQVIIVFSRENVISTPLVPIGFLTMQNRLCFRKDEVIARFEVPAGTPSDKVEDMFAKAIKEMRDKADKRDLLPDIDKGTVGSLNYEEIKRLISRLAWNKDNYEVAFIVPEDVYTLGNLDKVQIKSRALK